MAYRIFSPKASFIQFDETGIVDHCIFDNIRICLPVLEDDDVAFQFVIEADTEQEIDDLCGVYGIPIEITLIDNCAYGLELLDLTSAHKPDIFRLSGTQLLVNWPHGFPGFTGAIDINECFAIKVEVLGQEFCSNCLQRISDDCFTSVIEYGNDENSFGFNYCESGEMESESGHVCEPTVISFTNKTTLTIPYTTALQDMYGPAPTTQIWIYDSNGDLVNMGVEAKYDSYPVTQISINFGGPASGIVVIR